MSKSKKKLNDETKESLVNRFKDLLSEMGEQGENIDAALAKVGGKEAFLRHIQDVEDDFADPSEVFKKAYEDGDARRCVRAIVNIVEEDIFSAERGLRKVLYSEGNLLKNPLNYRFDEAEYEKTKRIIILTINHLDKLSKSENKLISAENAKLYNNELVQLLRLYECLYTNRIENEKRLNESVFLQLSLPQIIQSFLVFFQSQYNLLRKEMSKRWKSQEYVTGFEAEVSSECASSNSEGNVSFSDSFEHLLEAMDTLFRYVFFLKGNEKNAKNIREMDFVTPYESSEYAMIATLSSFDKMFSSMESYFRYFGWNITLSKTSDGKDVYGFYPSNEKSYKTHIAAKLRRECNVRNEMFSESIKEILGRQRGKNGYTVANVPGSEKLPGGFFCEYLDVSNRLDLNDIESFHFGNDYKFYESHARLMIESAKKRSKLYYFACRFNDMCVEEYLDAYAFVYTFSKVYYCAVMTRGEQKQLVPLISLDYLYDEFSKISGYDREKAKKLIKCFVFDKEIAKEKKLGDIFARPLICVGSGMILLPEALVEQINLNRNIEVLLEWNDVNIAPMGKDLEHKIIDKLKNVPELSVNTKTIEFMAYDNRNVEFDFVARLEDYIIIMELKSILQPYDNDELYRRHKPISDGIEQVIRRTRIIREDWDKFKDMCDIDLPDKPYDEDHIIKIVCTDIADFTGLEENGVFLTDDATVLRFFTNPYVLGMRQDQNSGELTSKKILWSNDRPTAREFISYLRNPDTMDVFMQSIGSEWKPIPYLDGYKLMAFQDMVVKEDPIKKLAEKYNL